MRIFGEILIGIGTAFLFLGGLGIFRLPDVYNRLQAGTKCTTLGAFSTILGVGFVHPNWMMKAIVIGVFILLTNPISAHALARASYKSGVRLWNKSVVDRCQEFEECQEIPKEEEG
jgi:multicomponent Na+:H+ antiporter subunit G